MLPKEKLLKQIYTAMEQEPRIRLHAHPVHMELSDDGALTLDGEVEDIAAKKLALELAGASEDIHGVVDRLRVVPSERRGDGAILDSIRIFFFEEQVFRNCTLRILAKGQIEALREITENPSGNILISVEEGVITLDGEVISLSHKRLAGVLAWWTPGCRDVVNGLEVVPPEQDNDDEVADALRLVWEKDPLLFNADQLRASVRNYIVNLEGLVPKEEEKNAAELDAWYLFGVDKVINRIEVR